MNNYYVNRSKLSGVIAASPSKSQSLRALLFASMANGKSVIKNCLNSPDVDAMIAACQLLGAKIKKEMSRVEVIGVAGNPHVPDDVINAGNSGQVLRFIAAIAGLIDGYTVLTGDASVRYNRPIKPLMNAMTDLGAECISTKGDDHAPIIVKGPMLPGTAQLEGSDSQPVSGLLIASVFLKGTTKIHVQNPGETPWIGLTLDWFDRLGISYSNDNFEYYIVNGKSNIDPFEYTVPGDFSSIAYPLVAALITQSALTITNIDMTDPQGDKKIIDVLLKMGADISLTDNELVIKPSGLLRGYEIDVNSFIDAITILAVLGCYAEGRTKLTNASIARFKESDRITTICTELKKMGADITENEDGLTVIRSHLKGTKLYSHHDHRIAMSLVVAACGADSTTKIEDVQCVSKSYSTFFEDMKSIGCLIESRE